MKGSDIPNPSEQHQDQIVQHDQKAYQASLIILIIFSFLAVTSSVIRIFGASTDETEFVVMGEPLFFGVAIAAGVSAWLTRHGRANLGITAIIASMCVALPLYTYMTSAPALMSAAMILSAVVWLAWTLLPRSWQGRAIMATVLASFIAILIDLFFPNTFEQEATFRNIVLGIAAFIFFGFVIFRQYRTLPLRTKLILAFLSLALIPFATLALITNWQASNDLNRTTQEELVKTSRLTASAIDDLLKTHTDAMRSEAQLSEFVDFLLLPHEMRSGSAQEELAQRTLDQLVSKDRIYLISYGLLDTDGVIVADTKPEEVGLRKGHEDYFMLPMQEKQPYISPLLYDQQTNGSNLIFSHPIIDRDGNVVGILRIWYNGLILQDVLHKYSAFEIREQHTVLVDKEYYICLAHSNQPDLIFKSYSLLNAVEVATLQSYGRLPPGTPEESSSNLPEVVTGLQNAENSPIFTASDSALGDQQAIFGTAALQEMPWLVLTRISRSASLEPVRQQTQTATILAMLIASIVALTAVGITQALAGPIVRLKNIVDQVGSGDLTVRANIETQDEIGQLALAFDEMTDKLQIAFQEVEQRITQRSRSLELSAQLTRQLSTILDADRLVSEVVDQLHAAFNYYHVHIYLLDEAGQLLIVASGTGEAGKLMRESGYHIPMGKGLVGTAAQRQEVILSGDTRSTPNWLPNPLLPDTRAEIAVPIKIGDQVLGVLDVQDNQVNGLDEQDANLLVAIANQTAFGLANARRYQKTQQQAKRETALSAVVQQIQATRATQGALQVTARELGRVLNLPRTRVWIDWKQSNKNVDRKNLTKSDR